MCFGEPVSVLGEKGDMGHWEIGIGFGIQG
jgi:hypothetical protein